MKKEQWMWILGRSNITRPSGKTIPIGDDWDSVIASIIGYGFNCPLLGRSELRDVEHNAQLAPVIGVAREFKVLTKADAEEKGLSQIDDEALYARVEVWTDDLIAHVSPYIATNFLDDRGTEWPYAIQHIAVVGQPQQQTAQPVQADLAGIALSRGGDMPAEVDEKALEGVQESAESVDEAADDVQEVIAALQAEIAALKAQLDELLGANPAQADEAEDIELRREIKELRKQIQSIAREQQKGDVIMLSRSLGVNRGVAEKLRSVLTESEMSDIARISKAKPEPTDRASQGYSLSRKDEQKPAHTAHDAIRVAQQRVAEKGGSFPRTLAIVKNEMGV